MTTARDVDEYFARIPREQRPALDKLRTTIRAAAPNAAETISYQMPSFTAYGRGLVSYAAFKDHYSLFAGIKIVDAHKKEVAPFLSGRSTIQFAYGKPLPVALVRMIVKERLAENAARSATKTVGRASPKRSAPRPVNTHATRNR